MTPILLCLNLVCPAHDAVFVDEAMHCVAVCIDGHGPSPCFVDNHSTTACFEDDGQSSLCDAEWIVVPTEAAP